MARIVFFGTPALSVSTLRSLHAAGHEIVLVVTRADKRRGRGGEMMPSPVKAAAIELGLPVTHEVDAVLQVDADLGVLVAFGRIIKADILERLNILNLHPSLLPRWRGATPVEAAILAGDRRTGICIMQLVDEMDAGPVYARWETAIGTDEPAQTLYERLFEQGNQMLSALLTSELPIPQTQVGEPTFCGKFTVEQFHIRWNESAENVVRLTRVGRPWTSFRGRRLLILDARVDASAPEVSDQRGALVGANVVTADGQLTLLRVQPEGKGPMDATAWLNGVRPQPHEAFE